LFVADIKIDPSKLFEDLKGADLIIIGDEHICLALIRNHYIIENSKSRVVLLTK